MQQKEGLDIAQFVLPDGLLEYFNINDIKQSQKELYIYLEEKNDTPQEYKSDKLTSKGFFEEIKVQDFPIRGKGV